MKKLSIHLTTMLILLAASTLFIHAEVKLPAIFSDNMVLQQQTDAAIWGTASVNSTVTVKTSWNKRSYTTRAGADGRWKLKVATPAAGGPYTVMVSQRKTITLRNVMIGEVWVCSGQSNMEMPLKGYFNQPVSGSNEYIATSTNDLIRLSLIHI